MDAWMDEWIYITTGKRTSRDNDTLLSSNDTICWWTSEDLSVTQVHVYRLRLVL